MINLFSKLLSKYQEKYPFSLEPIVGLILLKSTENNYQLIALRTSDSMCGINKGVGGQWTQALYLCASFDDRLNTRGQIPVEKWQKDNPSCRHKSYRELNDLSDLIVDSLSRNQIRKGHSGMWFMPARSC